MIHLAEPFFLLNLAAENDVKNMDYQNKII